jgi:hypothetical protein
MTLSHDPEKVPFIAAFDRASGRGVAYGDAVVTVASGDFEVASRFGDLPMIAPRKSSEACETRSRKGVWSCRKASR